PPRRRGAVAGHSRPRHRLECREIVPEPPEGLPSQAFAFGGVGRRVVLALAGPGQRRGAGGVVAVLRPRIVGERRPRGERLAPEAGRGRVELLGGTEARETGGLVDVGRSILAAK